MGAWFAAFWSPADLPGLRQLVRLYDQVGVASFSARGVAAADGHVRCDAEGPAGSPLACPAGWGEPGRASWGEVSVGPVWALAVGGVMPWKPQHPDDFPTLRVGVLDWWADLFPSPRDPAEPFVLTDSQARGCWSGSGWIR